MCGLRVVFGVCGLRVGCVGIVYGLRVVCGGVGCVGYVWCVRCRVIVCGLRVVCGECGVGDPV